MTHVHDFVAIGARAVQPRPGLPDRADRRPRRRLPGARAGVRLAPRAADRRRDHPGAVHGRPGHHGRPDLAVLLPELPQGDRPALLRSTSGRASTRCARSTTTTAAGPPTQLDLDPLRAARHPRRARRRRPVRRHHRDRARPAAGPPAGARHRHPAARPGLPCDARRDRVCTPPTTWRTRRELQATGLDHGGRQRAERRRDLPRPARRHRRRTATSSPGSPGRRGSSRWSTPSSPWR